MKHAWFRLSYFLRLDLERLERLRREPRREPPMLIFSHSFLYNLIC